MEEGVNLVRVLPDFSSQNRQVTRNSDFFFILQSLIRVRFDAYQKWLKMTLTRTSNTKISLFINVVFWELFEKILNCLFIWNNYHFYAWLIDKPDPSFLKMRLSERMF